MATSPSFMFSPPALLQPFSHAVEECGHVASHHSFVWSKRAIGKFRAHPLSTQPGEMLGMRRVGAHVDKLSSRRSGRQVSRHAVQKRRHIASSDLLIGAVRIRVIGFCPSFGNARVRHSPGVLGIGRFVEHIIEPVWVAPWKWFPFCIERHIAVGMILIEVPGPCELFVRVPVGKNTVSSRGRRGLHMFDEGLIVFPVDGDGLDG